MPTDVEEVLEDVLLFTQAIREADRCADQSRSTRASLPPVEADPDQLKQVFLNLVTNAVQVMEECGRHDHIETGADEDFVHVDGLG